MNKSSERFTVKAPKIEEEKSYRVHRCSYSWIHQKTTTQALPLSESPSTAALVRFTGPLFTLALPNSPHVQLASVLPPHHNLQIPAEPFPPKSTPVPLPSSASPNPSTSPSSIDPTGLVPQVPPVDSPPLDPLSSILHRIYKPHLRIAARSNRALLHRRTRHRIQRHLMQRRLRTPAHLPQPPPLHRSEGPSGDFFIGCCRSTPDSRNIISRYDWRTRGGDGG